MFCNNLLILFDDYGDARLAKELLGPAYLDCIWDEYNMGIDSKVDAVKSILM
jgi:hypothetical protein